MPLVVQESVQPLPLAYHLIACDGNACVQVIISLLPDDVHCAWQRCIMLLHLPCVLGQAPALEASIGLVSIQLNVLPTHAEMQ